MKIKTIDAKNQSLGRVASAAAMMLMGKDEPGYKTNVESTQKVQIINASKVKITGKKLRDKKYQRYTEYPGGLKEQSLSEMITKKGFEEVFRKAIYGMMPKNTLKAGRMRNLEIID